MALDQCFANARPTASILAAISIACNRARALRSRSQQTKARTGNRPVSMEQSVSYTHSLIEYAFLIGHVFIKVYYYNTTDETYSAIESYSKIYYLQVSQSLACSTWPKNLYH